MCHVLSLMKTVKVNPAPSPTQERQGTLAEQKLSQYMGLGRELLLLISIKTRNFSAGGLEPRTVKCDAKRPGSAQKETKMAMRNTDLLLLNLFYPYFLLTLS